MRSAFVKRNPDGVLKGGRRSYKQEESKNNRQKTHSLARDESYPRSYGKEKRGKERKDRRVRRRKMRE